MEGPKSFEGLRRRHAYVMGGGDGCEGILRVVSAAQRQDERSPGPPPHDALEGLAFLGTINQAPGRSGVLCRGRGRGPRGTRVDQQPRASTSSMASSPSGRPPRRCSDGAKE